MSVLVTVADYITYMDGSGTYTTDQVQTAIDMAELDISGHLGYGEDNVGDPVFVESQWTKELPYPQLQRPIQVKPRVATVVSVTVLHDESGCDCEWTEYDGCAFIHDASLGIIKVRRECFNSMRGCWNGCSCSYQRVRIVYTAGFSASELLATASIGKRLRHAICLQATTILLLLSHYTEGAARRTSFSAVGYSESREVESTAGGRTLGSDIINQNVANMLKSLVKKSIIIARGR